MATHYCTSVMMSQDHSQCSSHVVLGELLPKIEDEVDNVLGLVAFYQYVRTAALNQQQTQHVSVFNTELFAHYLHIRCLSVTAECRQLTQATLNADTQRYQNRFYESSEIFITDVLINVINRIRHTESKQRLTEFNDLAEPAIALDLDTSELVELLQQSAIEHLNTVRELQARDVVSDVATVVTTDFEALYAYKCGQYQRCLHLSMLNVRTLIDGHIILPCVGLCAFPEFVQLMDDDIGLLVSLILIAGINRSDSKNQYHFLITQLSLSLYLMTQCQMKLRDTMTSLAQTLDHVEVVRRNVGYRYKQLLTLDELLLKLTERKILRYISDDS